MADVYVINTCSVTENADKECRYLVRRIQRQAPESFVVITGCYAQLKPAEIAQIPGVDPEYSAPRRNSISPSTCANCPKATRRRSAAAISKTSAVLTPPGRSTTAPGLS
ncbi:hypothetical protein ACQ86N_22420 [Puia sp. P3]|uniref:hypothetical protein n=1 Tax=Puia sp. P3 TaxID=3423952 RepID=UPI003D67261A